MYEDRTTKEQRMNLVEVQQDEVDAPLDGYEIVGGIVLAFVAASFLTGLFIIFGGLD